MLFTHGHAGRHHAVDAAAGLVVMGAATRLLLHLAAHGYAPAPSSKYQFNGEPQAGLVIGIANLSYRELELGFQLMTAALRQ